MAIDKVGGPTPKEMGVEQEPPKFKRDDKVRLTPKKIAQLAKENLMYGFPQTEGIVESINENMLAVRFGNAVRQVDDTEIEIIK